MAVLREPLHLVVKCGEHGLALADQVSALRLESQVPDGVEDDFELLRIANFHEVKTDQLCECLGERLNHLFDLFVVESELLF